MGYYLDLNSISLKDYKNRLKNGHILQSRMILKQKIDERFDFFENTGIKNIQQLLQLLKKKDKFAELSKNNIFSEEYLTILLRELNSILPKPNKLSEFSGLAEETIKILEKHGIKDTSKLFDKVKTPQLRKELAKTTGINEFEINRLTRLTDLSRIKWAAATFTSMLYDLGIDTVEKVSQMDPGELHKQINQINKEKGYFKGAIGLNDMKIFVDAAKDVPLEIEY